jgi:hypothetical protein
LLAAITDTNNRIDMFDQRMQEYREELSRMPALLTSIAATNSLFLMLLLFLDIFGS